LEKERDRLEELISKLEVRQNEIHEALADSALYEDKAKALKIMEEQRELEKTLSESMERWEELCLKL
jgi:division protein CdvB (Snf7/Vps24/ESCRT-III family)